MLFCVKLNPRKENNMKNTQTQSATAKIDALITAYVQESKEDVGHKQSMINPAIAEHVALVAVAELSFEHRRAQISGYVVLARQIAIKLDAALANLTVLRGESEGGK